MPARIRELKAANKALSKRQRAKKRHIRVGGPLTIYEATEILAEKDAQDELGEEMRSGGGRTGRRVASVRHCSNCSKTGHNFRIY